MTQPPTVRTEMRNSNKVSSNAKTTHIQWDLKAHQHILQQSNSFESTNIRKLLVKVELQS